MRRFHLGSSEWSPPRVPIQLPLYGEGSLGWLLSLIRRQRLDVLELQLAPIADACMQYWSEIGDLDEGGDAVAAIAYLTERKAQRLLTPPVEDDIAESDDPLFTALPEEYRLFSAQLRVWEEDRSLLFFRAQSPDSNDYELPLPFGAMEPSRLLKALQSLLERALPLPVPTPERPAFSVQARMIEVLRHLDLHSGRASFESLLPEAFNRLQVLTYFLAMLELARLHQVDIELDDSTSAIIMTRLQIPD